MRFMVSLGIAIIVIAVLAYLWYEIERAPLCDEHQQPIRDEDDTKDKDDEIDKP